MEEGKSSDRREVVDLHSQLEELLSAVRDGEANWRFDDRLDLATRPDPRDRRVSRPAA
jgi:hypothetical protein